MNFILGETLIFISLTLVFCIYFFIFFGKEKRESWKIPEIFSLDKLFNKLLQKTRKKNISMMRVKK